MPARSLAVRFWLDAGLALLLAGLAIVTALSPRWIELVSGLHPDGGNGESEWAVVTVLAVLALWRAARAHGQLRRYLVVRRAA